MAALNEADFADPTSLLAAMGHSTRPEEQIWLDPSGRTSLAPRTGGMIQPVRYDIKEGSVLYRFGSQLGTPAQTMSGGWWIERRELDQLIRFGEINDRTLGYAVRLLCCVPPEWGTALNLLVAEGRTPEGPRIYLTILAANLFVLAVPSNRQLSLDRLLAPKLGRAASRGSGLARALRWLM